MNGTVEVRASAIRWAVLLLLCCPLLGLAQEDAKELTRKGALAIRNGNYSEAKDLLARAMKLDPKWAEPHYHAAQLLRLVNKREDMKRQLKIAWELEPGNATYRDEYSKVLKEELRLAEDKKDAALAKSLRQDILKVNPEELEIGVAILREHFTANRTEDVRRLGLELLDKNKKELPSYRSASLGEVFLMLAKTEFAANNLAKAREYADKATRYPIDAPERAKELLADVKKAQRDGALGHLKLGKAQLGKGDLEGAKGEFEAGLALDPDNEELKAALESMETSKQAKNLFALGMQQVSAEKWLEARDLLEQVVYLDPANSEAKKHLAKAVAIEEELMKKLGRTERLPRSSTERAKLVEASYNEGRRYREAKNLKDARSAFDKALAIITLDAKLEKYRPDIDAELAQISTVDNHRDLWDKGREQYRSGEYEEALKTLEQLPPDYAVDQLSYLAYCHWKTGNNEKAKELANLQLAKQPENNRAKFILGNLYFQSGDSAAAFKILQEIKDADPDYPGIDDILYKAGTFKWGPVVIPLVIIGLLLWIGYIIYNNLPEYNKNAAIKRARHFLNKGMYKECINELNAVKRLPILTPFDGMLISRIMAQAYLKTAAYDRAIGECKHLLSGNPQDEEAHRWLGFAYLGRRMMTPESLPELLNLYKTEAKNLALVQLLGQHYTSQKVLSAEGVQVLERWLELEPNNPDVLKPLGKYYLQKGRTDEFAMKVFQSMLSSQKAEPEFYLGVAKLHLKRQQYEECLKLCEQVLSMDMNNELVHSVLRECYQKMGKLPELVEVYRAFLADNPYNVAFQKGLTEAMNLMQRLGQNVGMGGSAPPAETPEAEGGAGTPPPEGAVVCPHCQKPNTAADYYCQHCGKSIA